MPYVLLFGRRLETFICEDRLACDFTFCPTISDYFWSSRADDLCFLHFLKIKPLLSSHLCSKAGFILSSGVWLSEILFLHLHRGKLPASSDRVSTCQPLSMDLTADKLRKADTFSKSWIGTKDLFRHILHFALNSFHPCHDPPSESVCN